MAQGLKPRDAGSKPALPFASLLLESTRTRRTKGSTGFQPVRSGFQPECRHPSHRLSHNLSLPTRALLLASSLAIAAAETPPPGPAGQELWIPQNEIPAALKSHPRAVLLTREQYEILQRDAKPPDAGPAEAPPAPIVLRSLTMSAQPAGEIVIAQAEMSVDVLSTTPAALPLHFEPAILAALELDESGTLAVRETMPPPPDAQQAAPLSSPHALLPPGRHTLKATLHLQVAVSAAGRTIAVRGTTAGASSFSLTLPVTDRIESALAWTTKSTAEGSAVHTFTLPPGDKPYAITWSTRDIRDLSGTALVQSCDYTYTVDAVRLHAALGVQLISRLAALPAVLTIPVPAEARILSVEGADVLSWEPAADKLSLTVNLTPQSDRHATNFTVSLDVAMTPDEAGKPRALTLPFPQAAGVHRASGRFVILTEGDLRMLKVTPPPLAVQNTPTAEHLAALSGDFAGLWDFAAITAAPVLEIEDLAPVFHATQDTQIELRRDGVHLTRHLGVVPRQSKLFSLRLTLPAGEELIALTQKDVALLDWRKVSTDAAGTLVEIHFPSGLRPGDHPVLLLTSRVDPPNWNALPAAGIDLSFGRAAVAGADKLSGFIAVAAEDRFAVSTAAAAGLESRDPSSLGDDVPVRGGFVWFAPGDFKLPLHVSPKAAEFEALLSAFALPLLHAVEFEGSLDLDIRQSGLRDLTVKLPPAAAPFLRFDTPLVSGTKLNAANGEWAVTFREELRGRQSLRWRMSLPVTTTEGGERGFKAELPVLQISGARRSATHWVMEANTDTELSFDTTGLEERDTLTLPVVSGYTPRHRVIAAWSARGSDWKLSLTARRHLPAALPALVVDRYALVTSVSTDGTLRHLAALTVRTNGQQFLDLPLPAAARILTLLVDNAPQKPAASGSAALRAQLPSGSLKPVTIALTWQVPGESWDGSGDRKIEPMRLPNDIPVLESTWTLRLPEGFVYSDFRSDLQRVNGPRQPELTLFPMNLMSAKHSMQRAANGEFRHGGGGGGSSVKFRVNLFSAPDVFSIVPGDARLARGGNWLETQLKTITSRETLLRVVKELKLEEAWGVSADDAVGRLESMIETEQERGTEIVTVRVRDADSTEGSRIAHAVVAAYETRRLAIEEDRAKRLSQNVAGQVSLQEGAVEKSRMEMLDVMKKHGIVDLMPLSSGQGTTSVVTPGVNEMQRAWDYETTLEQEAAKMKAQLETLIKLEGEQLIVGASELGIQNSTILKVYPEYQSELAAVSTMEKSGYGSTHPKVIALKEAIKKKHEQLLAAAESYRNILKIQLENSSKMLADARERTQSKTTDSVNERQMQSDYATSKIRYESQLQLLNAMREHSMKQGVDMGVMKKPIEILSFDKPVQPVDIAGLLPLEFALPDEGEAFHFSGHQVPGAMTFSARSLHQESRAAWLWVAAGIALAGALARRRTWFRGLLGVLLLWLVPWLLDAGMGAGHKLLLGWCIGCGCVLVFRFFAGRQVARMATPLAAAALIALVLLPWSQADAQEQASVLVPYDPAKPLAGQNPQQVYVDYTTFQMLWQQARDQRLAKNVPPAPALSGKSAAVISALYEAAISGGVLKVEALLTVHTTGEWAVLPLRGDDKSAPFAGASIAALTLDEKAAVLQDGALLVEKPGRHVLRASLHAPVTGDWRNFSLKLPQAPAALVSLSHGDASLRLKLNGGLPLEVSEKREGGYAWRGTAALGSANELRLERLPAVTLAAGAEKPTLGAVRARLFVTPAIERLDSRIDYAFAGAERRDFSFAFDAALTPVQIDIANLESWSLREADGRRVLDFHLSVPVRDGFTAGFLAERAASAKPGDEHKAPAVVPVANRQEYTLEILSSDDLDLVPRASGGWARSELQGMGTAADTGFRSAGAWKLAGVWSPLSWSALARPLKRSAQADYAWKIAGGMLETTVTFTLRAGEHEDLSSLVIPLPPGAALQTLDGERLKDWWRAGDSVELRFAGATAEATTVWLDFTQPITDAQRANGLPLPCLTLPGFEEMKGRAVLATGPETDVRLRLDDKPVFAREVEAEQARGDYLFLPPLTMRRGFTFETPVFHATALLELVEPQFAARWVLGAAVQDTWTETQFRVDVELRQGALPEVRFVMPAGMPEARVTGDEVRETVRTALADGRAEYRVIFQSPVADAAALIIGLELPHAGNIALPDIEFPGAALTERFLVMQNLSSGEIVPDMNASTGVEVLSRDTMQELHFTVQGFTNPLSWRLKPGWKLVAAHRALEATSGPQAVVLYAELTTMLRAEGPEWLRAVYHLQNRALQFLPLRLPDGMDLVSATVAGSPVRADAGMLPDGKPGLLIPLIQTRPGDLAMDVEIVCRVRNGAGRSGRTLEDPDIPGVSIQRTLWNVWTPPGYDLSDADGNMERVEERKNFMEKLEADFDELTTLSRMQQSSKDSRVRRNAQMMSETMIEGLEQKLIAKERDSSGDYGSFSSVKGGDRELSEAREKLESLKLAQAENAQVQFSDTKGDTKAAFATADKWTWDYNSSYLTKRSKDSGAAKDRQQELLYTNPVVNAGVASGNTAIVSKMQPDGNTVPAAKPAAAPTARRYTSQISSLNDVPAQQMQQAAGGMGVKKALDGSAVMTGKDDSKETAQQLFNDVRGVQRRRVTMPTEEGKPEAPATPPGATPASGLPPGPADVPLTASDDSQPPAEPAVRVPAPPPVLKPAGRVSIPVSFPVDGTVHRFRKVNDRAELSLTMKPVSRSTSSRWLAGGLLAAGLGVLWLVNRKQRAVVVRSGGNRQRK